MSEETTTFAESENVSSVRRAFFAVSTAFDTRIVTGQPRRGGQPKTEICFASNKNKIFKNNI